MIIGCHWRDLGYRSTKALRSRLHARFPVFRARFAASRFRAYPGIAGGGARCRILDSGITFLLAKDTHGCPVPSSKTRQQICEQAERIRRHSFDILGSGSVDYGTPIRWHWDPKSDYEWPADIPWQKARSVTPEGTDIKMPWELSRCHHLVTLATAWQLEGRPEDWREFVSQIRDWIEANPYPQGVNWGCPMDVAIRLVNWLTALGLFHEALRNLDESNDLFDLLDRSIWEHGWHVAQYLEASGPRCPSGANHLYADLCGLLAAGLHFSSSPAGRRWTATAIQGIEVQNQHQFLDDGSPGESSTSYHRLLLEMALWSEAVCRNRNKPLSEASSGQIDKALAFARDACDPAGNSPNIGDNDSGRLLVILPDEEGNHAYLWQCDAGGVGEIHHRLLTGGNRSRPQRSLAGIYPTGGFHILRSSRLHACLRAGHIGHGGAHAHCDQLSFTLSVDGIPFLVDPGSYLYTPDPTARNRFRSGGSHNIALPMGFDQNTLGTGRAGVFRMATRNEAKIIDHESHARGGQLQGAFEYTCARGRVVWVRALEIDDSRCRVIDTISPAAAIDIRWSFHFAPAAAVATGQDGTTVRVDGRELQLSWSGKLTATIEDTMHSTGYGRQEPSRVLRLHGRADPGSQLEITFHIQLKE